LHVHKILSKPNVKCLGKPVFAEEDAADMGPYFSWALVGCTNRHASEPGLTIM
jgi:hypothetical protein